MDHAFFYYLAGVPLLGVFAQWLAWRLRLPSILLLLAFGVALGYFIEPDALLARLADSEEQQVGPRFLFPVVSLSVAIILFEGGLTLRFRELKESGKVVLRLVTLGALLSWILTALAAHWILGMDQYTSTLIGAILVVTGPTVVGPLLRHIRPVRRVGSIAKWEGIVIDPIGAVLAVLVFEEVFASVDPSPATAILVLVKTGLLGAALGLAAAWILMQLTKRFWIPDYLQGVAFLSAALGVFALSNWIQEESGLVTVTVLGIILANQKQVSVHHIVEFKEHLGVLLLSCLFIVLGSRLDVQRIIDLGLPGLLFLSIMILVVRPVSVFAATIASELNWRERTFLAFLAPRGIVAAAVSSVFALKLLSLGGDAELAAQARQLVPVTFLVIVGTVLVYGLFAGPLARLLQLADTKAQGILFAGADPWLRQIAKVIQEEDIRVLMVDTNYAHVAAARMEGIPADCSSILSEHVREEIDLSGIGRLLAMTPNDEVNALAVREFAHVFGRANAFQLVPWDSRSGKRTSVAEHLRGRLLFDEALHHERLARRLLEGWTVKKTQITDEFTEEDFRVRYGEEAVVLFTIDEMDSLRVRTAGDEAKLKAGMTLIALIPPAQAPESSTA